jgi:hypothetical protein
MISPIVNLLYFFFIAQQPTESPKYGVTTGGTAIVPHYAAPVGLNPGTEHKSPAHVLIDTPDVKAQPIPPPSFPSSAPTTTENMGNRLTTTPNTGTSPVENYTGTSEKASLSHLFQQPAQFTSQHPETWTASQVAEWLQSKQVPEYIIEAFRSEGITGHLLVHLSKDDIGSIGVRLLRERLELGILIQKLKTDWRITDGSPLTSDVYAGNAVGLLPSRPALMEDGKGAPSTDLPPSYNP